MIEISWAFWRETHLWNCAGPGSVEVRSDLLSPIIVGGLDLILASSPDHMLLLLFIPNFYTATSKHKVLRRGSGKPELDRE